MGDQSDVTLSLLGVPWACAFGISANRLVVPQDQRDIWSHGVAVLLRLEQALLSMSVEIYFNFLYKIQLCERLL